MRAKTTILILVALCLGMLVPTGAGAKPVKPPSATAQRDLAVHWVRDVWQPYELRTVDLDGGTTPIASGVEVDSRPSWSPDGSRLAYTLRSTTDDSTDVRLVTSGPDGSDRQVLLTADEFDAMNAARGVASARDVGYRPFASGVWSPDGATFVFPGLVRYPAGDPALAYDDLFVHRLFAIDTDTSGRGVTASLRELLPPSDAWVTDSAPDWSATGWLVFVRAPLISVGTWTTVQGDRELWAVRPDDLATVRPIYDLGQLPHTYDEVAAVAWSPDGRHLVLNNNVTAMNGQRSGDLWVADVTATSATLEVTSMRALRATPTPEWSPTWSPDGTSIAFVERLDARKAFRSRLVLLQVSSGQERVVVEQTNQTISYPDWNPAGRSPVW